jgi:leucyl/phenylalanyl-tRNA---protein transferase
MPGLWPPSQSIISPGDLLSAYAAGVFPMAQSAQAKRLQWIDPDWRGVIPIDPPHVPKRLLRTVKTTTLIVRPDTAFRAVMEACAAPSDGRESTWINGTILESYCRLHATGHAHSIEVWQGRELVGGLYGVRIGAAFFGESMFSRVRDASKIALVHLMARLKRGRFQLLDAQFLTGHLTQFGAFEMPRSAYLERLEKAIESSADFYELGPAGAAVSGRTVLQETTQTS